MLLRLLGKLRAIFGSGRLRFMKDDFRYRRYDIGKWTYGDPKVVDPARGASLVIGKYCSIGGNVTLVLGASHRTDWVTSYPLHAAMHCDVEITDDMFAEKGDITIGNDVWICEGAMVLGGVTVGDGAVIGARSVVTKDVPQYTVVAGNPAAPIRLRFPKEQAEALAEIRWWDWPIEKIKAHTVELYSSDISGFIKKHGG